MNVYSSECLAWYIVYGIIEFGDVNVLVVLVILDLAHAIGIIDSSEWWSNFNIYRQMMASFTLKHIDGSNFSPFLLQSFFSHYMSNEKGIEWPSVCATKLQQKDQITKPMLAETYPHFLLDWWASVNLTFFKLNFSVNSCSLNSFVGAFRFLGYFKIDREMLAVDGDVLTDCGIYR